MGGVGGLRGWTYVVADAFDAAEDSDGGVVYGDSNVLLSGAGERS